jgi:hypothetical protein
MRLIQRPPTQALAGVTLAPTRPAFALYKAISETPGMLIMKGKELPLTNHDGSRPNRRLPLTRCR